MGSAESPISVYDPSGFVTGGAAFERTNFIGGPPSMKVKLE